MALEDGIFLNVYFVVEKQTFKMANMLTVTQKIFIDSNNANAILLCILQMRIH